MRVKISRSNLEELTSIAVYIDPWVFTVWIYFFFLYKCIRSFHKSGFCRRFGDKKKPASRRRSQGHLNYPIRQSSIRAAPAFPAVLVLHSQRPAGGAITVLGLVDSRGEKIMNQGFKHSDIGLKYGAVIPMHGGVQKYSREK